MVEPALEGDKSIAVARDGREEREKEEATRLMGQSVGCAVPPRVRDEVKRAAQEAGVTQFAVWQGAFAVWAARMREGREDGGAKDDSVLLVGPYGRRDEARFQRTVGYLLNMLVYRYSSDEKKCGASKI